LPKNDLLQKDAPNRPGALVHSGGIMVGRLASSRQLGNEPVRVAWGQHANDDKSPLMASPEKPNKEIPKTRNK
jgi:hypothetical protein